MKNNNNAFENWKWKKKRTCLKFILRDGTLNLV